MLGIKKFDGWQELRHFTIDRLMLMLDRLGQDVDVSVRVRPRAGVTTETEHSFATT